MGDDQGAVTENRRRLALSLSAPPSGLNQVHGARVIDITDVGSTQVPAADAAIARTVGLVCGVMTADCLPVLLCDRSGSVVAAGRRALEIESRAVAQLLPGFTVEAAMMDRDRQLEFVGGPELLEDEFEVWVVSDACSSRTERNRDAAFDRLAGAGAELVTTEMVAFEWLRTAEHPDFKAAQALIK